MFNGLPTLFTHTAPLNHHDIPLSQIVMHQNLPNAIVHTKKATITKALTRQILFQGNEDLHLDLLIVMHQNLPNAIVHTKKATITKALTRQILFQGNEDLHLDLLILY
jgi:ribosomal 50S subunit-associated protein YjgA (DUF615 family)